MESAELIVILIHKTKGMECCARVSSCSWGESSTQRATIKETMLPRIFWKSSAPDWLKMHLPRNIRYITL
jgi:hypothetical protein